MDNYIIFLLVSFLAALSPGPAVILAVRNGASYHFNQACIGILGNISAIFILATLSALGLGSLLLASTSLFWGLKLVGGGYLIYLGVKFYIAQNNNKLFKQCEREQNASDSLKLFKEAFLVGLSNPKAILFFTALFPQFINNSDPLLIQFILLTIGCCSCSFICLAGYAFGSVRLSKFFSKETNIQWVNRTSGAIFITFGAVLVISAK